MPPKSAVVDDFDDDTDFALPTPPTSNAPVASGGGMPGMPGMPQMSPEQMAQFQQMMMGGNNAAQGTAGPGSVAPKVEHPAESKQWITLYPLYFDSKRSHRTGERRVPFKSSSLYPQSFAIAKSARDLGLEHIHEVEKTHPKDWDNPGRVKVKLFDEEGSAVHSTIKNRNQLKEALAPRIQKICGAPPRDLDVKTRARKSASSSSFSKEAAAKLSSSTTATASTSKAVTKSASASASSSTPRPPTTAPTSSRRSASLYRLRQLQPYLPPAYVRLPPNSPALSANLLNVDLGAAMGGGGGASGAGAGGLPGSNASGPGGAGGAGAAGGANPLGALGSMMGNLGFAGDDADDDEEGGGDGDAAGPGQQDKRAQDPYRGLGRRGRKKIVRIGR